MSERVAGQEFRNKIAEILASCLSANDVWPRVKEVFDAFQEAGYTRQPEPKVCAYCGKEANAAMLQNLTK